MHKIAPKRHRTVVVPHDLHVEKNKKVKVDPHPKVHHVIGKTMFGSNLAYFCTEALHLEPVHLCFTLIIIVCLIAAWVFKVEVEI